MAEKTVQEVSRVWREQYEKGMAALERNNLDYAIKILAAVLEKEPAFFDCRQALRAAQFKKAGTGGGGFFKKMLGSASPKLMQAKMAARHRPLDALSLAEQVLSPDPNNLEAHKVLADAALDAGLPLTAVLSLEIVLKQAPKDREVALKLADTLAKIGQGARAEQIVGDLARANPHDQELVQLAKDVSARRTLSEGGYDALEDGKGSYRDILRNEQEAVTLEQEKREHKPEEVATRLLAEYEARVPKEPGNLKLLRSIAELYVEKKDFDKALEYYQRIRTSETADPSLDTAITETQVKRFDQLREQLDPNASDYATRAEQLTAQREEFLLTNAQRRVERYPNDLLLRFELGQLYFQAGRIGEAIQEFQKAQSSPHKRIAALCFLGQCFAQRGMNDLAARTFQNAIKEKTLFDDEKKELVYALGCALEKMGKKEEAMDQFKLIYELDIGYRDVAAKVDAFYSAQR